MIDEAIVWLGRGGWMWVPGWYLLMSFVTYVFYAADKAAAMHGEWRTKESTLHLLELLGGWPGALLAQKKLHHKSRKARYRFEFFVVLMINVGILVYVGYRVYEDGVSVQKIEPRRDSSVMVQVNLANRPVSEPSSTESVDEGRGSVSIRFVRE